MIFDAFFFYKITSSIVVVLGLSFLATQVGTRWAGIVAGLPTGSAIILYFFALDNGVEFTKTSTLYNISGLAAMQSFLLGYYFSSRLYPRPGIFLSSILAFIFYLVMAAFLSQIKFSILSSIAFGSFSIFVFSWLFRNISQSNIDCNSSPTFSDLLYRAILSAVVIVAITSISSIIGENWSGLFSAFPSTLYPLILILHLSYGKRHVDSVIKYVPTGLWGLIIFSSILHLLLGALSINIIFIIAITSSLIFLLFIALLTKTS